MDDLDPAVVEELRSLSFRYATGVDRRDLDLFLSSFHPDATLTVERPQAGPARPMHGHAEIGRVTERIAVYAQTFHFLGQTAYAPTETGASGSIACIGHHLWRDDDEGALDHVMYIRYTDEYRTGDDGRWRISTRTVTVDWSETRAVDVPGKRPR
jgi:hypothetical protein